MRLRGRPFRTGAAVVAILLAAAAGALAQRLRGGGFGGFASAEVLPNPPYDGRFTFVRLRYGAPTVYVSQQVPWSHDYPTGEQHFMKILNELSYLNPRTEESSIFGLDDAELFKHPVAYLCEPGAWTMSDREADTFRQYLLKGGFLIVDDFRYFHWDNFETQMRRVLPEARFVDLDESHPIFHAFFEIDSLDTIPNYYDQQYNFNGGRPIFRGIFEDNDPTKRLMVIVNYNTDISEYWEWSDTGFKPIDESNEAYKIGVNYIMYGMTH